MSPFQGGGDYDEGKDRFPDAPCPFCAYNGPGYYQPSTHPCVSTQTTSGIPWTWLREQPEDVLGNIVEAALAQMTPQQADAAIERAHAILRRGPSAPEGSRASAIAEMDELIRTADEALGGHGEVDALEEAWRFRLRSALGGSGKEKA